MSITASTGLAGLGVAVTRPAVQAAPLCLLLEQHGAAVVRLPMQAIEPARQSIQIERALSAAQAADLWIFTSANAVRHARSLFGTEWPLTIAVGPATAAALRLRGEHPVVVPTHQHNSEGVLALPELQDVRGKRIALITGEGGRDSIETALGARGADVQRIAVYRRVNLPYAPEHIQTTLTAVQAIIVTNGEALQQLVARTPEAAQRALLSKQLVVPSQRVVEQASQFGFTVAPLVPDQMLDTACVHCLEQWWRGRGRTSSA